MNSTPLTADQLIEALDLAADTPDRVLADRVPKLVREIEALHTAVEVATAEALKVAEANDKLHADLREAHSAETLTHQACQHGKHADWWADTEHNHRCPWCEIVRLSALLTGGQP